MLSKRIIPVLLTRGRQLIKGKQFNAWRSVGVAAQAVRIYQQRGVDELMLLDIDATKEGRGPDLQLIEELSDVCFMPLAVGGGVKSVNDAKALLRAGADKIVVKTGGVKVIAEIADKVGCQAVVGVIDYRNDWVIGVAERALELESAGVGEILLQAMDREGMMQGYDLEMIKLISGMVSVPVIASGGCGSYEHMEQAIKAGADGVGAGSFFQFTDNTPKGAARYLAKQGLEMRCD